MTISKHQFVRGIIIRPDNVALGTVEGEIKVESSTGIIKAYLGASVRDIVTNSQTQTLTNKTIDADSNTISNIANSQIKALAGIDATKIADGSVSNTEFQYLDGVTSGIQTQLNGKANSGDLTAHTGASSGVHGVTGSVVGTTDTQTLTAKTIDADNNTISNLEVDNLKSGVLDTDLSSVSALDDTIPSAKATKAYVDLHISDTSTHGVSGDIVGTTDTQTLTNKDLDDVTNTFPDFTVGGDVSGTISSQTVEAIQGATVPVPGPSNDGQTLIYDDGTGNFVYGSGGLSSGTAGSVQYSDGANGFSSDTSNFFYNSTDHTLELNGNDDSSIPLKVNSASNRCEINSNGSIASKISIRNYSASSVPIISNTYSNGTVVSPTAVLSGDVLGRFDVRGYYNTTNSYASTRISSTATENWSSTNRGSDLTISITKTGQILPTLGLRIGENNLGDPSLMAGVTFTPVGNRSHIQTYVPSGVTRIYARSDSLNDNDVVAIDAVAQSRTAAIRVYKHSGITNNVAILVLSEEDGARQYLWVDNSGNFRISATATHAGTTSGTVIGTQTSDVRLKEDIQDLKKGLSDIEELRPVTFKYKQDPDNRVRLGFIAQEVEQIFPECIFDTKEAIDDQGNTKLVMEYDQLIAPMIKAIQQLSEKVKELESLLGI